jgi:hemolysin activation/secretion protein
LRGRAAALATCTALFSGLGVDASAQTALRHVDSIDRVVERFEKDRDPRTSIEPKIPVLADQTKPPPNAKHIVFTLLEVNVTGDTVLGDAALRELYRDFIGKRGPVTRIYALADRIRDAYEARDVFAPTVIVPPQDLEDGDVSLRIIPFVVGDITVLADDADISDQADVRAITDRIRQTKPLTISAYQNATAAFSAAGYAVLGIDTVLQTSDTPKVDAIVHLTRDFARADGILVQPGRTPSDPPANADTLQVPVTSVTLTGATAVPQDTLATAWQPLLGKTVTLQQLYEAAKQIEAMYTAAGYVGTVATLPRQIIADGRVRIDVREMTIGSVRVVLDGKVLSPDTQVARIANQVAGPEVLRGDLLDRYSHILLDIPGVTVASASLPTEPGGEALVTLTRDRITGRAGLNNRGSRSIGRLQLMTGATVNGFLTDTDSLDLSVVTVPTHPNELKLYTLTETLLLGLEGTKLTLSASRTHAVPGSVQSALGIDSFNTSYSAHIDHPVIRSTLLNLHAWTALEYTKSQTDMEWGAIQQGKDKVTAWRFGANVDWLDSGGGVTQVAATVSNGLGAFGADDPGNTLDRPGSLPDFQKFQLNAERIQPLPWGLSLVGGASAQYSSDILPGSELMSFGGDTYGRVFLGGVVSGDTGVAARLELNKTYTVGEPWLMGVQPFVWYDIGQFWVNDAPAGEEQPKSAASTGLGLRATVTPWLQGQVEAGLPLINHNTTVGGRSDDGPQVYFGLMATF